MINLKNGRIFIELRNIIYAMSKSKRIKVLFSSNLVILEFTSGYDTTRASTQTFFVDGYLHTGMIPNWQAQLYD